ASASAASAGAGTLIARAGFIDGERAPVKILAVQGLDCSVRCFLGFHGDKGEAARAPAEFVGDDINLDHVAVGGEHVLELVFGSVEGKISYKQFGTHDDLLFD